MNDEQKVLLGAAGVIAVILAAISLRRGPDRAQWTRHVTGPSIQGAALDAGAGQINPEHLLWFGPGGRPPGWEPHRMSYPATPGYELERLMYGAPGACVTPNVPRSARGWLFAPPSEEDY